MKKVIKIFIQLLLASFIYGVICKFVYPITTMTQISSLFKGDGLHRDYVSGDEISSNLKLAVISSEDQLFPDHDGFDWESMEKSILKKHKNRVRGGGASTISQQTAKNVFLWQGEGFTKYLRKIPEFVYTFFIEKVWGKKRILNVYLNVIEMGPGIYGAEAAAQHYFNKSAKNLTKREAALIAASLPNPKRFIPNSGSSYMNRRANWIMRQMSHLKSDPDIQKIIDNN